MSHATRRRSFRSLAPLTLAALLGAPAHRLAAQAWFYPSFQIPRVVTRDYTVAVVGAGGADFLFQWREGIGPGSQLSLDAGLADPSGASNTRLVVGGQYAYELLRATAEQPLDVLLTGGLGIAAGGGPGLVRIPIGASVGHTFPLQGGMSVTPYVHPRVSFDVWTKDRGPGHDQTAVSLDFDIGASLAVTRQLAVRGSVIFSGNDAASSSGVGVGLTFTPSALRTP